MGPYKNEAGNWQSGEDRERAIAVLKAAEDAREIDRRAFKGCNRCGQTKGILSHHIEDCERPLECYEVLCWSCYTMQLVKWRSPEAAETYFDKVATGFRAQPYFKPDYKRFNSENGINPQDGKKKDGPTPLGLEDSRKVHEMVGALAKAVETESMSDKERTFVSDMNCMIDCSYTVGQGKWIGKIHERVFG